MLAFSLPFCILSSKVSIAVSNSGVTLVTILVDKSLYLASAKFVAFSLIKYQAFLSSVLPVAFL